MSGEGVRLALVVALIVAPWALVLVAAIARGYSITLVMERRPRRPRRDDDEA